MSDIINKTAKASSKFLIINLLNKSLNIVFIIIVSRAVTQEEFGILMLAISIAGIFQIIGNFGLPVTIQKFIAVNEVEENKYLGAVILLGFLFALIMSVVLFFLAKFITDEFYQNSELIKPLKFISISAFFTILYSINRAILQSRLKLRLIAIYDLIRQISKVLLLIIFFKFSININVVILAMIISILLAYVFSLVNILKSIGFVNISLHRKNIKKIFSYSLPLVFVGVGYFLAQQTDKLMIGAMVDARSVGIYAVASNIVMFGLIFRMSFVNAFMPILTNVYNDRNFIDIKKMFLFLIKWPSVFLGALLLLFSGWGEEIIQIFGKNYVLTDTYSVLLILAFNAFFSNLFGPAGGFLQLTNGNKVEFANTVMFVIFNIFFNYVFILKFGVIGAAVATLLSVLIFDIIRLFEIYIREKFITLSLSSFVLSIMVILSGSIIVSMNNTIWQKLLSVLSIFVYVGVNFINMSKEEKYFIYCFKIKQSVQNDL